MRKIFYIVILLIAIVSCQQKPGFVITGNIQNAEGESVVLKKAAGRDYVTIDSTIISNNTFKFEGSVDFPDMYFLEILQVTSPKNIFLENSAISVTGDAQAFDEIEITGSTSEMEFQDYLTLIEPAEKKMEVIFTEYPLAQQSGDEAKIKELFDEYTLIEQEINEVGKQFIVTHPTSFVSAGVLGHLAGNMEADEIEELLNVLDTKLAINPVIGELQEKVKTLKITAIGQPAPDFELNDANGNPIKLSDKIGSKLLLLDFWAAWCNPCREENPNVVAVYNKFKDKGFDVFGVSLDQDKEAWLQAISDDKLTWTHVSQLEGWTSDAVDKYAISSIPANFLLDENGIIVAKDLRGEDLENKVKELLGE